MNKPKPVRPRFESKICKTETCWLWTAGRTEAGYGTFWLEGKTRLAHRVSWELHKGPMPDGLDVLHRCDNPPCVNPDHLFLGEQLDNMQDMFLKGRARKAHGEQHANAKVKRAQVEDIRRRSESGEKQAAIGKDYGLSPSGVSRIVCRRNWK